MADNLLWHKSNRVYIATQVDGDVVTCNELILEKVYSDYIGIPLPWDMIGVHKYGGTKVDSCNIPKSEFVGKVMKCGQILCKWMPKWVMSKVDY